MTDFDSASASREVFGNIAPWGRVLFYALMAGALAAVAVQLGRRVQLWRQGQADPRAPSFRDGLRRVLVYGLAQRRVHRRSVRAGMHLLLFSGFAVLTLGTTLLAISDQGPVAFHRGAYYLLYELAMEIAGVALCIGCALSLWQRLVRRVPGSRPADTAMIALLLGLGISGFVLEALRLRYTAPDQRVARWSSVGWSLERFGLRAVAPASAQRWHQGVWWFHSALVASLFVGLPRTRLLHGLTAPAHLARRRTGPDGAMAPLAAEDVERRGYAGAAKWSDFTRTQLLSLDACMECGRCTEACPAHASGKPLSPQQFIAELRAGMNTVPATAPLGDQAPSASALWACTECHACVQACPTLIHPVDFINDLRRYEVGEGRLPASATKVLVNLSRHGNPYGRRANERFLWADGLDVPTPATNPGFEYLVWFGCAVSFDPRAQRVARAFVALLKEAEVNFATLGNEERCTGDTARRLGDEFLFQQLAETNIQTFAKHGVKKIVTPCPHCLNTLRHEYGQFGGRYEVMHHSELLAELLAAGRLAPATRAAAPVTFHDPCYLARVNGQTAAPRALLGAAASSLTEMPRAREKTACCGAGGGRMWLDEAPHQRVSQLRMEEAAKTGCATVATACPFCLNMLTSSSTAGGPPREIAVRDVAEILADSCLRPVPAAAAPWSTPSEGRLS